MSLKSSLLKPTPHIEEHSILGTKVFLRRLTIAELDEYEHDLQEAQKPDLVQMPVRQVLS